MPRFSHFLDMCKQELFLVKVCIDPLASPHYLGHYRARNSRSRRWNSSWCQHGLSSKLSKLTSFHLPSTFWINLGQGGNIMLAGIVFQLCTIILTSFQFLSLTLCDVPKPPNCYLLLSQPNTSTVSSIIAPFRT